MSEAKLPTYEMLSQLPPFVPEEDISMRTLVMLSRCSMTADTSEHPIFTDPGIYSPIKVFGPVHGSWSRMPYAITIDRDQSFRMPRRGQYIDLSVHASPKGGAEVLRGLSTLARFIEGCQLDPICILAATYAKMGHVATRYGFTTVPIRGLGGERWAAEVDAWLGRRRARKAGVRGELGSAVYTYQKTADFLLRFGGQFPLAQGRAFTAPDVA